MSRGGDASLHSLRRLARLLVTLLVPLGLLIAACGGNDVDTDDVDAEQLLESAAARMDEVETFHFALTHEGGTAEIVRGLRMRSAEGDVAGPDRMQMTVAASAGPVNVELSMIVLPDESWMTNPITGRWERESISLADFFDPASGVTGIMRLVTDATVTGSERIGGVDTYVVEASVDSGDLTFLASDATPGRTLPARAWIGVEDSLVYRLEVEGAVGAGEPEGLLRRLTLSRFGDDIEITPPR
jgi:hypothetical protein